MAGAPRRSRMDMGGVAARLEQREADGVGAGAERAAAHSVAAAGDPAAAGIGADVEVTRQENALRSESGHRGQLRLFQAAAT